MTDLRRRYSGNSLGYMGEQCDAVMRLEGEKRALEVENEELKAENKRLRDALTEIWQLDSPGQCGDIANRALEDE